MATIVPTARALTVIRKTGTTAMRKATVYFLSTLLPLSPPFVSSVWDVVMSGLCAVSRWALRLPSSKQRAEGATCARQRTLSRGPRLWLLHG